MRSRPRVAAVISARIQHHNLVYSELDAVLQFLRDQYADYRHLRQQPFTDLVRRALESLRRSSRASAAPPAEEESSDAAFPARKVSSRSSASSVSSDQCLTFSPVDVATESVEGQSEPDMIKSTLRGTDRKRRKPTPAAEEAQGAMRKTADEKQNNTFSVDGGSDGTNGKRRGTDDDYEKMIGDKNDGEGPTFQDLGGMRLLLDKLEMEVIVPLARPETLRLQGGRATRTGILLYGPPGCGKTKLAHAIANESGVPFYQISATEVLSAGTGSSEENIRKLFKNAYRTAPSIIFIDEIDAIASKRKDLERVMDCRIVTQLITCMDESHHPIGTIDVNSETKATGSKPRYVLVIGATNRPDALDPALRRPGWFDQEIALGIPDENARVEILSVHVQNLILENDVNLFEIARSTPGYVGADLVNLVKIAVNSAMQRKLERIKLSRPFEEANNGRWWSKPFTDEECEHFCITMTGFQEAVKLVQPSSRREGFSSIPEVKWEDVGGLTTLRKEFDLFIIQRIKHPKVYERHGVKLNAGILLYGPPGCGKTLVAKAVANDAGANFIHIKGPELLNKYVGESELFVRTIFKRAQDSSPCIVFFDELLIELDGSGSRQGVYIIGATNRPEVMDPAFLRPGRFGKVLYVPLPTCDERTLILKALARNMSISPDVDLDVLASKCNHFSGADLAALMDEVVMAELREELNSVDHGYGITSQDVIYTTSHFERALKKIKPSVSEKVRRKYEKLSKNFGAA